MITKVFASDPSPFNEQVINRTVVNFAVTGIRREPIVSVKSSPYYCKHDMRGDVKVTPMSMLK